MQLKTSFEFLKLDCLVQLKRLYLILKQFLGKLYQNNGMPITYLRYKLFEIYSYLSYVVRKELFKVRLYFQNTYLYINFIT